MSDLIEKARQARAFMQVAGQYIPDEKAFQMPSFFDLWRTDTNYETGDKRRYTGELYRCLQNHKSQDDWAPDVAVSLWVKISDPAIEWPDWVQPVGGHDAYAAGAKVTHTGKHWTSDIDANVWEPGVYGWTEAV